MTTDATANPQGSQSAQPSNDLDNPDNLDFYEPEDEANNEASASGTDPERETDEASPDDSQESDDEPSEQEDTGVESGDTDEPAEKQGADVSVPDDAMVTLENGEKVRFGDLRKAPMLEKDYRHKTMELGNQRRELETVSTRISGAIEAFTNFLAQQLPEEPSPALAIQNPGEYVQKKAVYDASLARIQGLIELGTQTKGADQELSAAELRNRQMEANEKLLSADPTLRDPKKREAFNKKSWEVARHLGFTPEELGRNADHRLLLLGDLAYDGMKAREARSKLATKVQNVPPATPVNRAKQKGNPQFLKNKEGMRKLEKSGSIHDAMSIDFD